VERLSHLSVQPGDEDLLPGALEEECSSDAGAEEEEHVKVTVVVV